jgi:transposase-like protein
MRKQSQPRPAPAPAQPPEPEKFERWTAQRKAAIIHEVLKGQISVPEACRKYGFTQHEFREWADEYHRGGLDALKVNKQGLEAEYRVEVKRLQAKIGELVMENEIRKEAMRPFTSVEPMLSGSLLDDDGQMP